MATLEDAILLAVTAHKGQRDKVGQPYILHPLRVMLRLRPPATDDKRTVARIQARIGRSLLLRRPSATVEVKTPCQTVRADFPHTAFEWSLGSHHYADLQNGVSGYWTVPRRRWSPRFQKDSRVHLLASPGRRFRPLRLRRRDLSRR